MSTPTDIQRSSPLPSFQLATSDPLYECTLWGLWVDRTESPNALRGNLILATPHWSPAIYPIWPRQIGKRYLFDDP